jgi:hypothetical protein
MLKRIISGGQTGSDRAGLDVAMERGIDHGGWCPAGRKASDGEIPERYRLQETEEATYPPRTERNVKEADATVIFFRGPKMSAGCALTKRLCEKHEKPYVLVDIAINNERDSACIVRHLIGEHGVSTLNVAGSRENKSPGIYYMTFEALDLALGDEELI